MLTARNIRALDGYDHAARLGVSAQVIACRSCLQFHRLQHPRVLRVFNDYALVYSEGAARPRLHPIRSAQIVIYGAADGFYPGVGDEVERCRIRQGYRKVSLLSEGVLVVSVMSIALSQRDDDSQSKHDERESSQTLRCM